MGYETFAEFNDTTLAGLLRYPASVWTGFIPLLLTALFLIVLMSTYFSRKRRVGDGYFMGSFAVASFFTMVVSIIMSLIGGIVPPLYVIITMALTLVSVIVLVTNRN